MSRDFHAVRFSSLGIRADRQFGATQRDEPVSAGCGESLGHDVLAPCDAKRDVGDERRFCRERGIDPVVLLCDKPGRSVRAARRVRFKFPQASGNFRVVALIAI